MRGVVLTFLLIARTINSNKSNNIRVKQKGDGKGNYKFNLSLKVSKLVRVFKLLNKQILRFISFR